MIEGASFVALTAAAAGMIASKVTSLVPSNKDFLSLVALKKESYLEEVASKHCFLMREYHRNSISVDIEDMDGLMRGDGRTNRDYYAEYAESVIGSSGAYAKLARAGFYFKVVHSSLFVSVLALAILALVNIKVSGIYTSFAIYSFLAVEVLSLLLIYFMHQWVESIR